EAEMVSTVDAVEASPLVAGQRPEERVVGEGPGGVGESDDGEVEGVRFHAVIEALGWWAEALEEFEALGHPADLEEPAPGRGPNRRADQPRRRTIRGAVEAPLDRAGQVVADLAQRPPTDRRMTLQEPLDVEHHRVEAREAQRASSTHEVTSRPDF